MSSNTQHTPETDDVTPWDELTDARQRVAKAVVHLCGPAVFERPDLLDQAKNADLDEVVDDPDRVLTSLKYTTLLNALEDEGYLVKIFQGGKNPIILDLEFEDERDQREAAPYGYDSALHTVKSQVLEREGLTDAAIGDVDDDDFNAVRDAVNRAVGKTVLVTVSDASQYRFTEDAYPKVHQRV